jgi:ribosomal protein L29
MKKHDLTGTTAAELRALLDEQRQKIAQFRFDLADKKLKRTSELRNARRTIARILTALRTAN